VVRYQGEDENFFVSLVEPTPTLFSKK